MASPYSGAPAQNSPPTLEPIKQNAAPEAQQQPSETNGHLPPIQFPSDSQPPVNNATLPPITSSELPKQELPSVPAAPVTLPPINGNPEVATHQPPTNGVPLADAPASHSASIQSILGTPTAEAPPILEEPPKPEAPKEVPVPEPVKEESSKEETPREETPREEPLKQESAKDDAPKPQAEPEAPRVESPKADTPKEATPAQDTPKEETPKEATPAQDTLKEEVPKQDDIRPTENQTPISSENVTPAPKELAPEVADVQMKDSEPEATKGAEAPRPKSPSPVKETAADEKMEDAPPAPEAPVETTKPEEPKPETSDDAPLPTSEADLQHTGMSQLALETQPDQEQSTILDSVEVNMEDAPSSAKIAREREDDDNTEAPAAKRARTEPEEDKPETAIQEPQQPAESAAPAAPATDSAAATPVEASAEASALPTITPSAPAVTGTPHDLTTLPNWQDAATNERIVSPYQRREIRKIISRIKKTKGGANFKDSVQKLWPGLWDAYRAKIDQPMDLSELDKNLRDEQYPSYSHFKEHLKLIYLNAYTFNGAIHDVTTAAFNAVKAVWEESLPIPADEPVKPKPAPKAKPIRESRAVAIAEAAQSRRQSAGPASPAVDDGKSQDGERRGSTDGDRPKRTVRAPKPKDIDYTTKPSRKKLKPELQFGAEVLTELMSPKHERLNMWFLEPVDAEGLNIPNYYSVIKKPMDLGKVSRMLAAGEFTSLKDFEKNVRLIFDNCYAFNGPIDQGNPVSLTAKELENVFNNSMKGKDAWLAKHAKQNAPSNASDDEDDEDDDDVDDAPAVDNSKEITELNAKLQEETKKLHAMFVPGANQSMIDIQKGIVDMVQQALMKAVASASEAPAKADKKKRGPKGKGGRKSTGGAPAKKAGAPKKASGKKNLTAADKDAIANAINDLDYPHLDKAIDIIKKDTGQNENTDGELELDIDQLSNAALLKLWDLCKSVLPGFGKDSAAEAAPEPKAPKSQPAKATAGKPKKNKPMSAQEQESRIAQLMALRQMYKDGQEPGDAAAAMGMDMSPPAMGDESSDDSDSEEE